MNDRDALLASLNAADNEIDRLRQQVANLQQQLRDRDRTIQQAKDISPIKRPTLERVQCLAKAALMYVYSVVQGKKRFWILNFGIPGIKSKYVRRFKTLREIWTLLSDDFCLSDVFEGFLSTAKPKPITRACRLAKQRKRFFYDPDEYDFYDAEQRMVLQQCEQFVSQTYDSA